VGRDPIPGTRAAVKELVAAVGGPTYDTLVSCAPAGEDGKTLGRSTIGDLLGGTGMAQWATVGR
jgi:hypothetical protein